MKYKEIGKFILKKIRDCDMAVGEFEKRAGYSHQTVWLWTSGKKIPNFKQAIKIEILLKLRKYELINLIEKVLYEEEK